MWTGPVTSSCVAVARFSVLLTPLRSLGSLRSLSQLRSRCVVVAVPSPRTFDGGVCLDNRPSSVANSPAFTRTVPMAVHVSAHRPLVAVSSGLNGHRRAFSARIPVSSSSSSAFIGYGGILRGVAGNGREMIDGNGGFRRAMLIAASLMGGGAAAAGAAAAGAAAASNGAMAEDLTASAGPTLASATESDSESDLNSGYALPPAEILSIVDAPPNPSLSFSPKRERVLFMHRPSLTPISELARPELKLAGVRIDPEAHSRSRMSFYTGVTIHRVNDDDTLGDSVDITGLPPASKINFLSWSPDGQHLAFTVRGDGEEGDNGEKQAGRQLSLWVADVATGKARQLLGPPHAAINAVFDSYAWLDGSTLIASIIPPGHPPLPTRPAVPPGPKISDNQGGVAAQSRTFTDLLKDEFDARLLEHFALSQIVRIDINDPEGSMTPIGPPDMYMSVEPSHDGKYLLVERMCRPFSFEVPCGRFPRRVEVWRSDSGDMLQLVADLPLADNIPVTFNSVRTGRRSINWRPDVPNCLYWVETQDGGDAKVDVSPRDIVYTLPADPAPGQQPQELCRLDLRYGGITWGDEGLALVYESWFKSRRTRTWAIAPGGASGPLPPVQRPPPKLIFDRSYEDRYSDPGGPLLRRTSMGTYVLAQVRMPDGALRLLLAGDGASPEGNVPFLDLFDWKTGEKERVWRSDTEKYFESMYSLLGDQEEGPIDLNDLKLILSRESKDDPPQSFVRRWADGSEVQLTHFPHPYPSLRGLSKEIIRYTRSDGVQLTAKLFLPPGYNPATDGPLPTVLWAYPREYKSKEAAGQVQGSPNQFPGIGASSPLLFLARGYAVLSGPSMPIIGQGEEEANDRFVEQLVASAEAAVDEVVGRGVAQRDRIAIGGHSYGAFMAANLLAHAPHLFACAIAQSGAYNRTLTPFSFQSEERTLWQVPEVYMTMSPFLAADRIKSPILLVHGQDDNNTGTFPMQYSNPMFLSSMLPLPRPLHPLSNQTERFFAALKGHGVTTRMVLLPHEGHGYRARESLLHVLAEQSNWLDRYCKNRPAPAAKEDEAVGGAAEAKNEPVGAAVEGAKEEESPEANGSWLRASL
ncbi:unnamed protein product [Closterium sp. NIES-53]